MTLAAVGGFVAVAFGAFAAHGVTDPRAQELLRTGAHVRLHALPGDLRLRRRHAGRRESAPGSPRPSSCPASLLFSGSLYAMALGRAALDRRRDADRRPLLPDRLGDPGLGGARAWIRPRPETADRGPSARPGSARPAPSPPEPRTSPAPWAGASRRAARRRRQRPRRPVPNDTAPIIAEIAPARRGSTFKAPAMVLPCMKP